MGDGEDVAEVGVDIERFGTWQFGCCIAARPRF